MMSMKSYKIMNLIFLVFILLTMLLSWFGFSRGVQEIQGKILLSNPLMLLFLLSIVGSLFTSNLRIVKMLAVVGFGGIVCLEVYYFLTWYILTITGEFNLSYSLLGAYPEFYISFCIAGIANVLNIVSSLKIKEYK